MLLPCKSCRMHAHKLYQQILLNKAMAQTAISQKKIGSQTRTMADIMQCIDAAAQVMY